MLVVFKANTQPHKFFMFLFFFFIITVELAIWDRNVSSGEEEEAPATFTKSQRHSTHSKVYSQCLTSMQHWPNCPPW